MATLYTIPQIINIARVSQYIASNEIEKRGLYGGGIDLQLPRKLYLVRKNIEWLYALSPSDSSLIGTSNFLYALCAPYNQQAAVISGSTSGGSVSPINPSGQYAYVSLPYTVTVDNVQVFQTNDLIGGNNLAFIILNDQILTLAKGEFSVNYTTGTITFINFTLFIGDTVTLNFNKKA